MNIREPHQYKKVRNQRRLKHGLRKLRRATVVVATLIIIAVLVAYVSYVRAISVGPGDALQPIITPHEVALSWPAHGEAAVGVDGQGVMAQTAIQNSVPTASVAKIMLALAVLKKYPLQTNQSGPLISVTADDVASYNSYLAQGGSVAAVHVGEQFTEFQALQLALLPSANNIADLLARWAYGSIDNYTQAANQMTQDLNMQASHFADASGFLPETVSSPRDLVLLGQAAWANPVLKQIVAQPTAAVPNVGVVNNTNFLLGQNGIVGIKTGNTDQAGGCYLFASNQTLANGKNITVIGAIMGAPTLYRAVMSAPPLLTSFMRGFGDQLVIKKGQVLARYNLPWDGTANAMAAADVSVFGWNGVPAKLTIQPRPLSASASLGQAVGSFTVNTEFGAAKGSLVLQTPVTQPSLRWRIFRN